MKAIIKGKRYDTDKATELASASSRCGITDFGWWSEKLYRTPRSGAYFLAGEGHARSRYATSYGGGSYGPGEKIIPMTEDEAFQWAQESLTADETADLFPHLIEDA